MRTWSHLLINPTSVIASVKKQKNYKLTFEILFVEWFFAMFGFLIFSTNISGLTIPQSVGISVVVFIAGIFYFIFDGFLIHLLMNSLGQKGKFYEGLTTITFGFFPFAVGFVVASLLSLLPFFGFMLSWIVLSLTSIISLATFVNALKMMFETDF